MKSSIDDETLDQKLFDLMDRQEEDFLFQALRERHLFNTKASGILFITLLVTLNVFLAIFLCGH